MRSIKVACIALASLVGLAAAANAEPLKIRMGYVQLPGHLGPILFQDGAGPRTVMKHYGKSYVVDPIRFRGTTPSIQALAAKEIEIAAQSPSSFALAIQNAKLDVKVVADTFQDNGKTHWTSPYMVMKDSGIEKIEDMKGKVAATNGLGSGVDIAMRSALNRHGLQVTRDYTMIEAPFPAHKAILKEKKADLVVGVLPFSYDPEMNEFARPLFTTQSGLGSIALSFWAARKGFIDKNRTALVDLMEDYGRALRWYYDPANHKQAVAVTAGFLKRPPAAFEGWLFTKRDFYRDPDAKPDLKVVQSSIDKVKELGFIKETVEVAKFADLNLVEEAAKRPR